MARALRVLCVLSLMSAGTALAQRVDPLPFFAYKITAPGVQVFIKCSQLGSETDVIQVANGDGSVSNIPGRTKYVLNCSRGFTTDDTTFSSWRHDVETGASGFRKSGTIDVLDTSLHVAATFQFFNAWPSSLYLNAGENSSGDQVVTEDIKFALDGITRN